MDNRQQAISDLAYGMWEAEGCPEGRQDEHWSRAEQEFDQSADIPAGTTDEAIIEAPVAASKGAATPTAPAGQTA